MCKYLIVSGGVVSGCGKGISAASIGLLLKMRGERVQIIKFDPYFNVSASTLSPYQHGECWVCDDGSETDLDLGHYERITGCEVSSKNICTSGTLLLQVIENERQGKYLGQTIQVIPHVTDKIHEILHELGKDADIVVVEIGGTVGDFESGQFFEAVRQFQQKLGKENVMIIHVAPILWLNTIGEFKTKPLQKSIIELQKFGLQPDILLCRVDRPVPDKILSKISHLVGISRDAVFDAPDVNSVYEVPISFYDRHIDDLIADKFHLRRTGVRIHKYRDLVEKYTSAKDMPEITIGIIGKYTSHTDAYLSLKEAIYHAAVSNNSKVNIRWIEAGKLEDCHTIRSMNKYFEDIDGVIVPGGFDNRGVEGKIKAIQYVREKKIPFLGICLGLQCAVIEFSRNVCGIKDATSEEFSKDGSHVIHYIDGQENLKRVGGTLRLGAYDCDLVKESLAYKIYKKKIISERHRHRYEVNQLFCKQLEEKGLKVTGINPESELVEIMELDETIHPFFLMSQAHPEFKSRLGSSAPLFHALISAAAAKKKGVHVEEEEPMESSIESIVSSK
jgi:CTP synthase